MKKIELITKMIVILLIAGFGLSACDQADEILATEFVSIINVGDEGETNVDIDGLKSVAGLGEGDLTEEQIEWLKFMREEEKLAGDVYRAFYELYNVPIFKNISKAEDNHTAVVLAYLEAWEIDDPVIDEPGVFSNEDLQKLYDELIEAGNTDLTEALKVGALVEEVDIKDLKDIYELEAGDDLILLAEALQLGSRNHLRAFTRFLSFRDVEYEPVILSVEDYEAIVNSPWERGTGFCIGIGTEEAR